MCDAWRSLEPVKTLDREERMRLKHICRDGLQAIMAAAEERGCKEVVSEAINFSEELRRIGL